MFKEILKEYENDRRVAGDVFLKRQADVYLAVPEIEKIDDSLRRIGMDVAKAILQDKNADEMTKKLEVQNEKLVAQKERLLYENGFAKDHLETVYKCDICRDTGYIEAKRCICFKQKLILRAYSMSNLADILKHENFDNFDISYYSEEVTKGETASPRDTIKENYEICMNFVKNFGTQFDNLLLYGSPGLGKTYLCNCIAKDLLDNGVLVMYTTAFKLFKAIEDDRFRNSDPTEPNEFLQTILDVDLLIVDDLGTEFSTILTSAEFFNFINTRLINKKPTIISTNLSPKDLINQYSDRIVSRLLGCYTALKFIGKDIRIVKKFQNIN